MRYAANGSFPPFVSVPGDMLHLVQMSWKGWVQSFAATATSGRYAQEADMPGVLSPAAHLGVSVPFVAVGQWVKMLRRGPSEPPFDARPTPASTLKPDKRAEQALNTAG